VGRRLALLIAWVIGGCGSDATAPTVEPAYDYAFLDTPAGDTTTATANPQQVKALDLLQVSGRVDSKELVIVLEFAEPVSRWTEGGANSLDGFVHFDTDTTGSTGYADAAHSLGVDFYLDLRDDGFGRVGLVEVAKRRLVRVAARFDGATVTITVPRSELTTATDADARFRMAVDIAARGRLPNTDTSPTNGSFRLEPAAP
jgi:hypothetical protein